MEEAEAEKVKKMKGTTTVGIVCSDGVVFAADRRATMGYFIANKETQKIFEIDRHLAMTVAGGVGDAQMLARLLQAESNLYRLDKKKPIPVVAATTLLANILNQYRFAPFYVQLLVGGVDDKPRIYNLDAVGGVTDEKFVSTGSGSLTAYGYLEDHFREGRPVKENLRVAAKAVSIAIKRDAGTGEGVDLVAVTKAGFKRYAKDEVQEILEEKGKD
ncbi:MAG: archaeal proteasome endopeptidase complex subunit beta [Candidatus ainarchaeum sp.]|nr:archaeal proteasome endopeptidase complex subunit beta [Candidatus ainarchaeum sp.]